MAEQLAGHLAASQGQPTTMSDWQETLLKTWYQLQIWVHGPGFSQATQQFAADCSATELQYASVFTHTLSINHSISKKHEEKKEKH